MVWPADLRKPAGAEVVGISVVVESCRRCRGCTWWLRSWPRWSRASSCSTCFRRLAVT